MSVMVVAIVGWGRVMVVGRVLWVVGDGVGGLTGECALDGSEVLGFFVLNLGCVDWDSVHWCWGITVS